MPLLWTMQKLPVQVDLYRNMFRPQTKEALQSWFRGEVHPYDDLWKQDMVDLDIIFLANGDRDVHRMIRQGVMKAYPHLRIVAVVHKADRWDIERTDHFVAEGTAARQIPGPVFETVNALIRQDRWTFVTISPHVKDTLSSLFLAPLHTGHSFGQLVHVFIPVRTRHAPLGCKVLTSCIGHACPTSRARRLSAFGAIQSLHSGQNNAESWIRQDIGSAGQS